MDQEIKAGDWISWPGSVGTQTGKVLAVSDVYDVQVKVGSNTMTTMVPKGSEVKKVDPPEEDQRPLQ